jgi:hypothetical protein
LEILPAIFATSDEGKTGGKKKEAKFLLLNLVRKERYPLLMRAEEEYLAV